MARGSRLREILISLVSVQWLGLVLPPQGAQFYPWSGNESCKPWIARRIQEICKYRPCDLLTGIPLQQRKQGMIPRVAPIGQPQPSLRQKSGIGYFPACLPRVPILVSGPTDLPWMSIQSSLEPYVGFSHSIKS